MIQVSEHIESRLSSAQLKQILLLVKSVWPDPEKSLDELVQETSGNAAMNPDAFRRRYVVWEDERAVAHARIFPRTIISGRGELSVIALAGVCVADDRRGKGYGNAVVEEVFRVVAASDFDVCLFQTSIQRFYDRFGCRIIDNEFIDSQNSSECDPWWEDCVMIYPASFVFPTGCIDLNGPGY